MIPRSTIQAFDAWLDKRRLRLEGVVIGGAALALLDVTTRETRDFDVLHPRLPEDIASEAKLFAAHLRQQGVVVEDEWLNNGPIQLGETLPPDWVTRVQPIFEGASIRLTTLGRADLLKTKLFALCDRGTDWPDCVLLRPTDDEIAQSQDWVIDQDTNPMWPEHVRATLAELRRRLQHG